MLKKSAFLFLSTLLLASGAWAQGLEVGFSGEIANMYFRSDRTVADDGFDGLSDLYYDGNVYFLSEFAPGLTLKTGYESDSILRRRVYSQVSVQASNITFSAGPYYGILNTSRRWFSPGILFDVRVDAVGVLFFTLGFETNFSPIMSDGDYYHSGERASFGFYVPNGIITLSGEFKTFQTPVSGQVVRDDFHRGAISTEIFFKNFPFKYTGTIAFQGVTRDYVGGNTHQLFGLMFGNKILWEVNTGLAFFVDADLAVHSFGWEELDYQLAEYLPLGRAEVGLRLRFVE